MISGMPTTTPSAGCLTVYVERVFAIGGRLHLDVYEPYTAQKWVNVPLLCLGGSPGSYFVHPVTQQAEGGIPHEPKLTESSQVLLVPRMGQKPVAFMAVQHPDIGYGSSSSPTPDPTADRDVDQLGPTDAVWANGDTKVVLGGRGDFTVDAAGDEEVVRFQLAPAGVMRVSRGGEALDNAALASPVTSYATELASYLGSLDQLVRNVVTALGTLVPPPAAQPELLAEVAALPTVPTIGEIRAAVLKISADTEV